MCEMSRVTVGGSSFDLADLALGIVGSIGLPSTFEPDTKDRKIMVRNQVPCCQILADEGVQSERS